MFSLLLLIADSTTRTEYGVPVIRASTWEGAFRAAGKAAAEDRLWQMETSRRAAHGRMAEILGAEAEAGDRETLKFGYTDEELQTQVDQLPPKIRAAFIAYSEGVNEQIQVAKKDGTLPAGYTKYGIEPEPWTPIDSAAISVKFLQTFGRGGAGELRNLALVSYLQTLSLKEKMLDVFDDMVWTNIPSATVTLAKGDDPRAKNAPKFPRATRAETDKHLSLIPKVGLMELLPGIRVAQMEQSRLVAERAGAPYKSGSYAMVVSPKRSATGHPILLSAPQMGFRSPSIVCEVSMMAPGLNVTGMSVPGVPGVMIGMTDKLAWGMTTGVADTEDVVFVKKAGAGQYLRDGKTRDVQTISRTLRVRGKADQVVVQKRTVDGPVVIDSAGGNVLFVRKSSFYRRELASFGALYGIYEASDCADLLKSMDSTTVNFNFFFATKDGSIGYAYTGLVPQRASGWDVRLPIPAEASFTEFIPRAQMPHAVNPPSGLLANWNNKPTEWWDNGDTPVWGEIFRDRGLRQQLTKPRLSASDLERAAWQIARLDDSSWAFEPALKQSGQLLLEKYDGQRTDMSYAAGSYRVWLDALRESLFAKPLRGLMTPDFFKQAVQPSLILRALNGKTKFNYLQGRKPAELAKAAASSPLAAPFRANVMQFDRPVYYMDRGTYIQIVELGPVLFGRNVMPPGQTESGPHQFDQVPLAQNWFFKPMSLQLTP